jgi:hypothetical protein
VGDAGIRERDDLTEFAEQRVPVSPYDLTDRFRFMPAIWRHNFGTLFNLVKEASE